MKQFIGTGRRKSAVARVRLMSGTGNVFVNDLNLHQYFNTPQLIAHIYNPFNATNISPETLDIKVRVNGGGISGQAQAISLGIARAMLDLDAELRPTLRQEGLLTRDSRRVERKLPGHLKSRKVKQFPKR